MAVKQTIPSNTNQTKSLTFSKLRGVDYSSSPFEVSTTRASHMKNMINEDGVNHKRQGWTSDIHINHYSFEYKIYDICEFCGKYIVAWSDRENEIKISALDKDGQLSSTSYITCFSFNTKEQPQYSFLNKINEEALFVNGSDYQIIYDSKTDKFNISQYYYIPTTSISINSDDEETSMASYEEPNMFTSKRINSLIGKNVEMVKVTFKTYSENNLMSISLGNVHFSSKSDSSTKEISFRIVPGTYVVNAALSDGDGYDLLIDENSNELIGQPSNVNVNERTVTINEDLIIKVVEG